MFVNERRVLAFGVDSNDAVGLQSDLDIFLKFEDSEFSCRNQSLSRT